MLGLETQRISQRQEGSHMSDLAATFDAHVRAEFRDLDLEATMSTMADDPYVHHVPTITGGNGSAGVREFYDNHFIGQWPDDTETRQISRTVGENQVVDELLMTFTHDRKLDIMLPGIHPPGAASRCPSWSLSGLRTARSATSTSTGTKPRSLSRRA
jgi:carboxymethylenebutenolidase